ncbi:hypothetical protein [Methanosarcina horonobensis]|uniref:hypothetical protein n=1 Tax=Methanosarcina horonobensis TaxID=418008 RepID=UPI001301743F|nr:hypothetical protein [Methanosarcina horonobensis]
MIEKKGLIFFQINLLLIVLFASINPAMADEDPEETENPQNPVQFVGPISDYGLDMDGDGLYDYLVVKFNAQSNMPSTYFFTGDLRVDLGFHESKDSIAHEFRMLNFAKNSTYLNGKTSTVILNFEGGKIRENELNGPYEVKISLSNGSWGFGRGIEYTTGAYEYVKFEQPELLISGPVRSKARALELAEQNAAEAGINLGGLKDIDISSGRNGEIWIFHFEQNGTQECFAIEGNTVEDIRHWTLNETVSKRSPATPSLHMGCTVTLFAAACLFTRKSSAQITSQKASACQIKRPDEKND